MTLAVRFMTTLAVVVGLSAAPAAAQAKKKADPKAAKADPKAAPKLTPTAAAAKKDAERQGPAKLDSKGGGVAPNKDDVAKDATADKKRDEQIEAAKKIIPKIEDGNPQKADLLFQLSELYWEKSRFLNRKEMLAFFNAQKEADEKKNRGEKVAEAKEDHRESELYRSETMRLYETILREYPTYERKDEVLFNLAYNQYEIGKRDLAVKRYEELLKNYPGSKFVSDSYMQLGNHYFEVANVLEKAKTMYEKAFQSTNPQIKSYALYKLAWCDFNAGEHEKALKKLQDTVEFAEKQGKEKAFTDLKNEALGDSVRMFVQLNRADDAMAYYKAHAGKKKQLSLVQKLAYALAEAGHHDNSIKTFRFLLADNSVAESAPDWQQAIIQSYEKLRQRDQVKVEVKKLAETYRPGSTWWKANESKKEVLRNGFNVAEEAMRTTVTEYHQEAQKTKEVKTYKLARDIYKEYVDAFASAEDENFVADQAFNLKFYYAEILWALEEWEPAAKQYDGVTAFKVPNRSEAKEAANEKYRQSSAFNAILAYDKLVKIERGLLAKSELKDEQKIEENKKKDKVEKAKKLEKRTAEEMAEKPITDFEKKLVAACDAYNTLFPKNPDEVDIAYQAAVVFYDKNHFVEAGRRFGDVINKYPENPNSEKAADLIMAVLNEREEWLELNKLARIFKGNAKLSKPNTEFTKRVSALVEGSQYKYIDETVYKKEKDPARASDLFIEFVKEFPKSENADRALTYAVIIAQDANQLDKAIAIGERMLKEYPLSSFDLKVKFKLAWLYEKMANFEKSAQMYENFVATYDLAAGDKAIGYENIKALLKAEKEAKEKEAKANKGKAAEPAIVTVDLKTLKDEAKKKEREALVKEAEAQVADAQYNAGFWYEGVAQFDKAIAAYNRYVVRFKDKKDVPELAYNVGLVLEKQNKTAEALKSFDSFLTTYAKDTRVADSRRLEVKYRQYLLNGKLKNTAEQDRLAKDIIASFPKLKEEDKKNDRARLAFAHTRFASLEPTWKSFIDLKFKKIGTFKNELVVKQKKLTELENSYTEVVKVGNPEYGIAALTRIGLLYADLATSIGELPDPPGFDEDQIALFRGELENRYIFPLEDKCVQALDLALNKSYELSMYNEWTLAAQDKLNKYKPGFYGKVREVPYRGSEFFVTAGFDKKVEIPADPVVETPAPAPTPAPNSAAAPTPGAGVR
jgi:tetratricopeptide (TPR) repeat protein